MVTARFEVKEAAKRGRAPFGQGEGLGRIAGNRSGRYRKPGHPPPSDGI